MSVLVFLESSEGQIKKSALEALVFAGHIASHEQSQIVGVVFGQPSNLTEAGTYGAARILNITDSRFSAMDAQAFAEALAGAARHAGSNTVVLAKSALADSVMAKLASMLDATAATNVVAQPDFSNGFSVKRSIFTGKAFENVKLTASHKVISVKKNEVAMVENPAAGTIEEFTPSLSAKAFAIKSLATDKTTGEVLLSDAEIVVSGGRGLKGPENWGMVTDMAKILGAATGCSKPVSDLHWRPHHEHVGQTGIKVSPNLYVAIGISGAIQHVAGISSSKVIVAINKDADAPIFKVATYGIVGDAFDVVPKLTDALKSAI